MPSKPLKKEEILFLSELEKKFDELYRKGVIQSILRYRLARYRKYNFKGMASVNEDSKSYLLHLNLKQMQSLSNKVVSGKIKRWKANRKFYIYWYIQNALLSFSRLLARRWDKLIDAGVLIEESDSADNENISQDNECLASQMLYDRFEALFKEKNISPDKEKCFWDRLTGMKYSEMMRLYEPENLVKDPKGQKYRRRFDRVLDELEVPKEQVNIFLKEKKLSLKKEKKEKLT